MSPAPDGEVADGSPTLRERGGPAGRGRGAGRRRLVLLVKLAVSAGLVYLLLRDLAVGEILAGLAGARPGLVLAALALYPVGYVISITRWRLLLRSQGVRAPVPFLARSYLTALFFSNVLPSTIGGDAIRAYDSWRLGAGKAQAASIILVDRLLGLAALLVVAMVGLAAAPDLERRMPGLRLLLPALLAGFVVGLSLCGGAGRGWIRDLRARTSSALARRVLEAILTAQEAADRVRREPRLLAECLGLSLLLQVNVVAHWILLSAALDLGVGVLFLAAVVPLTIVLMLLPITVAGIGIRENALAFFLGLAGVPAADAVALAWAAYGLQLLQALPGGIIYFLRR